MYNIPHIFNIFNNQNIKSLIDVQITVVRLDAADDGTENFVEVRSFDLVRHITEGGAGVEVGFSEDFDEDERVGDREAEVVSFLKHEFHLFL